MKASWPLNVGQRFVSIVWSTEFASGAARARHKTTLLTGTGSEHDGFTQSVAQRRLQMKEPAMLASGGNVLAADGWKPSYSLHHGRRKGMTSVSDQQRVAMHVCLKGLAAAALV